VLSMLGFEALSMREVWFRYLPHRMFYSGERVSILNGLQYSRILPLRSSKNGT